MAITSPRVPGRSFPTPELDWGSYTDQIKAAELAWNNAVILDGVMDGKINATGTVTLTANSATTTLADLRIGPNSIIVFMPTTANAAAEKDNLYVSSRGKETATLTHSNNAQTDRTFAYAVLG